MQRPLTTVERSFLNMAKRVVMNPVVLARLRGSLDPARVQVAIEKVQARHPALQVRVVRDDQPWFTSRGVGSVPLRVVTRTSAETWRAVVRHELNDPFDVENGPLIRFVLVQGDDACELVCVTDHVNADGRSGLFVLRDVLRLLAEPELELVPLPDAGCFDTRLPDQTAGLGRVPSTLRGLIGERVRRLGRIRHAYRDEREKRLGIPAAPAPAKERIEFVHRRIDRERTEALVRVCRAHGVTVQSALTIACANALAEVRGHYVTGRERADIGCISPIDIRASLSPSVGDHFGIFAWAPTSLHRMRPDADFWQMAKQARASLARGKSPLALAGLQRLVDACEMMGSDLDGSSSFPHAWLDGTMVVSNLGRIQVPRQVGGAEVISFGFLAMIPNADFVVGVQTLDELEFNYCYCPSRLDARTAQRLADEVEATIDATLGRPTRGSAARMRFD
jgi:hypothetical protein